MSDAKSPPASLTPPADGGAKRRGDGGDTTTSIPAIPPLGPPNIMTRASRIITLDRSNFFLHTTMVAVLVNVLFPWWLTLPLLVLFVLWLGVVLAYAQNRLRLHERLMEPAENLIDRIQSRPSELVVAATIVVVTAYRCSLRQTVPDMAEVAVVLLMLLSLAICRNSRMPGGFNPSRTPWKRAARQAADDKAKIAPSQTQTMAVPELHETGSSAPLANDETRIQWEAKQKLRWEEWIAEEVTRLADDRDSDPKPPPPPKGR